MRPRQALAFKLVTTGIVLLAIALASIATTLWVSWQLEGGAAVVNEAGRMHMLTWCLALSVASGRRGLAAIRLQWVCGTGAFGTASGAIVSPAS
jgi:nitrate/nitrite-specific signal transduction histidine kinase